jgi:hypothetical protein
MNDKSRRAIQKYVREHGGAYDGIEKLWGDKSLHLFSVTAAEYADPDATFSTRIPGVATDQLDFS